jgi:enamine deaminase RidA (YjgF/YER057c/UK114 family)
MKIERIGRNPAGEQSRSRASLISVHNETIYFAAIPNRPIDPGASIAVQTEQVLKRVEERLEMAGSDKSRILMAHVMISDMRLFAEMNTVWDAWVDQNSPPVRACSACDLGSPDLKVEVIITAAVK